MHVIKILNEKLQYIKLYKHNESNGMCKKIVRIKKTYWGGWGCRESGMGFPLGEDDMF